jgi:hypothetical protein
MYRVAAIDWYSRSVLAWPLSNTLEGHFCPEGLCTLLARRAQAGGGSRASANLHSRAGHTLQRCHPTDLVGGDDSLLRRKRGRPCPKPEAVQLLELLELYERRFRDWGDLHGYVAANSPPLSGE